MLLLALAAAVLCLLADIPVFCEYLFARGVTRWLSGLLGLISNAVPVSLYEIAALLLVFGAVFLLVQLAVLLRQRRFARLREVLCRLLAAGLGVLLAFGALYAPLYGRKTVFDALDLSETQVTREGVRAAAGYYIEALNALSARMRRDEDGNVIAAHSLAELSDLLNAEYGRQGGGYFSPYFVRVKGVALSVPMSYLGITGIYMPFFAEANVNVNIPAYSLPVTMAHEMAHAKGVAQEGQANIVAYALCLRSEEAALRYSGLMSAAAALLNALPQEEFEALYGQLSPAVRREYANASAHYQKYEGLIDSISSFFNDLFLKANGVPGGIESYGSTVRALVSLQKQLSAG